MNETYKSLVNWYYIEDWSDYPGPKSRVVPDVEGYDNPGDYDGTELYIPQGTLGNKKGNKFMDEEGNDVPFNNEYFEKTDPLNENKMNKEFLYMQKLAGIITESEYKAILNENTFEMVGPDMDELLDAISILNRDMTNPEDYSGHVVAARPFWDKLKPLDTTGHEVSDGMFSIKVEKTGKTEENEYLRLANEYLEERGYQSKLYKNI